MTTQTKKIILATGGLVGFFALYEFVKTLLYPGMSVVTSHLISIIVVGIITAFIARYVLKQQSYLLKEREQSNFKLTEALTKAARDEKILRSILASIAEGLVITDRESNILLLNESARNLLNIGDRQAARLADISRDPKFHKSFSNVMSTGRQEEVRFETIISGSDSRNKRILQLYAAPLRLTDDTIDGVVGAFIDISKLEMLENIRQEFLSNVSHELRTPLTSITAYVETLINGGLEDKENCMNFLQTIQRNAERMHALVNDIAELSAIESGRVRLIPDELPLRTIVDEVFSGLGHLASKYGISLNNEVSPEFIITADRRRIEQILINLIDNAIKFNHPGGKVTVKGENSDDGDYQFIKVIDTGLGIPGELTGRVFERFFRVDRARSRAAGGTGLGLAIVKHLTRAHGGEALVKSEVGAGSEFCIKLPGKAKSAEDTRKEPLTQAALSTSSLL